MRRNIIPTALAITALALTGCASTATTEPAPTATVTVTAEPTQEATQAPQEVPEPTQATTTPAAPTSPAETNTAPVEAEGSYFGGEDSMVASVEVMDDDVLIVLKTHSQANATKTHAPYVLQEAIDNLTGSEHAAQIDLVAVYSEDHVMVASGRIPGGKWS